MRVFPGLTIDQLELLETLIVAHHRFVSEAFEKAYGIVAVLPKPQEELLQIIREAKKDTLMKDIVRVFNQLPNKKVNLERAKDTYELVAQIEKAMKD